MATIDNIVLSLKMGDDVPAPAPASLMQALERVEVTQRDQAPSGFQLTFHTEVYDTGEGAYSVVQSDLLQLFKRVVISVAVNGVATTVMDGFITQQHFVPAAGPRGAMFTVTGEDVSVKMDAIQISLDWPAMGDAAIVAMILQNPMYLSLGLIPRVIPTLQDLIPFGYVPLQNDTDRSWIASLAQQNGNIFYVRPGSVPLTNEVYWGPPVTGGPLQEPLNVNMGPFTNVDNMSFGLNGLAPFFVIGKAMETTVDVVLPVLTVTSTRTPALAANPVLSIGELVSLGVRKKLWLDQGYEPAKSLAIAQGMTDLSTDQVLTAQGELDVVRYGGVLTAPGLVAVRGAGRNYDGKYYVKSVSHQISVVSGDWRYTQAFTLTREGLGTTVERV